LKNILTNKKTALFSVMAKRNPGIDALAKKGLKYPRFLKPWDGYASRGNAKVAGRQELEFFAKKYLIVSFRNILTAQNIPVMCLLILLWRFPLSCLPSIAPERRNGRRIVDALQVNAAPATFSLQDHELTIMPQQALTSGNVFSITVTYHMMTHLTDGAVKDHPEEAITFVYGVERQVPTLERALEGCHVGDRKRL
jgi:hypothetical protein